ncbi:MATE family multidrug resistance protein [Dysgonomonas sp. PH5-45]|uniref:MATE family efflux transporter n=1 Tax=unclassified Dysgonomonas TaxID=2630389 RepID=UPI00247342DE|nr:MULTISPECIES: MATE family efflux transporter [unclassified Dysgonomonas]MDH6354147.1 MATE family multidrug resistance protein [Dysgonomonas sp. PH5-45]MDH6387002.1 MATE family multidrug resistance protein [Dysgonomonas sp. PH5-37]
MDKQILRLALPNIISNITVPLLGLVDIFIVGHLDSELYIGAIAIAAMIFNLIYWNFSFLRMGTSGFTAQAYGANNKQAVANTLVRSLSVAFFSSVVIVLLQYFILWLGFHIIGVNKELQAYVEEYFYIYIWAAPAILGMYAFSGWFVGLQDSKTPMFIAITVNLVNICLSLLFVFVCGMQIKGVALGAVIAQFSGLVLAIVIALKKHRFVSQHFSLKVLNNRQAYVPFFKVNGDIFLRTLCIIAVTTFFTAQSESMGNTLLAVNTLLLQLFVLFSYMMDGLAYAAEALTGKFIGAGSMDRLKALVKRLFLWGTAFALLFTLVYVLFIDQIFHLLTDKENIIEASKQYRWWALLIPIAGFSAFLWDGIFVGATASKYMRNSMFVAAGCFFAVFYALFPVWGNDALWLAFVTYLFMRGVMQTFLFKKVKQEIRMM